MEGIVILLWVCLFLILVGFAYAQHERSKAIIGVLVFVFASAVLYFFSPSSCDRQVVTEGMVVRCSQTYSITRCEAQCKDGTWFSVPAVVMDRK